MFSHCFLLSHSHSSFVCTFDGAFCHCGRFCATLCVPACVLCISRARVGIAECFGDHRAEHTHNVLLAASLLMIFTVFFTPMLSFLFWPQQNNGRLDLCSGKVCALVMCELRAHSPAKRFLLLWFRYNSVPNLSMTLRDYVPRSMRRVEGRLSALCCHVRCVVRRAFVSDYSRRWNMWVAHSFSHSILTIYELKLHEVHGQMRNHCAA